MQNFDLENKPKLAYPAVAGETTKWKGKNPREKGSFHKTRQGRPSW